jgi:hypothetical protein
MAKGGADSRPVSVRTGSSIVAISGYEPDITVAIRRKMRGIVRVSRPLVDNVYARSHDRCSGQPKAPAEIADDALEAISIVMYFFAGAVPCAP